MVLQGGAQCFQAFPRSRADADVGVLERGVFLHEGRIDRSDIAFVTDEQRLDPLYGSRTEVAVDHRRGRRWLGRHYDDELAHIGGDQLGFPAFVQTQQFARPRLYAFNDRRGIARAVPGNAIADYGVESAPLEHGGMVAGTAILYDDGALVPGNDQTDVCLCAHTGFARMTTMSAEKQKLVWIDLEMTGLDPEQDVIIEIATLVTDSELEIIEEGPVFAVKQSDEVLAGMDEWNTRQHTKSGLVDRVRQSSISVAKAEQATLDFLSGHVEAGTSPMCGNSIGQDRRFLVRYMPRLAEFFHYRNLDVSTLKILAQLWYPESQFHKQSAHLALDDIRDSVDELRFYRRELLRDRD